MIKTNKFIDTQINQDGILTIPNLHDAELLSLQINKGPEAQVLKVNLITENSKSFQLIFHDIIHLNASNFNCQNIVNGIILLKGIDLTNRKNELIELFPFLTNQKILNKVLDNIKDNQNLFIEVSSSVGCRISCICKSLSILEVQA